MGLDSKVEVVKVNKYTKFQLNVFDSIKEPYLISRRGGWAVESTGLENQQRGNSFVGSNPTLSAIIIS